MIEENKTSENLAGSRFDSKIMRAVTIAIIAIINIRNFIFIMSANQVLLMNVLFMRKM